MDFLDIYTKLMVDNFKEDSWIIFQFQGINSWEKCFELHSKCQIDAFEKLGCVKTCGNDEGMVIGYFTKDIGADKLAQYMQDSIQTHGLIESCSDGLEILQRNILELSEIAKPDWYMKYLDNDSVYILQIIVVDKFSRGTGIFRKLITPILNKAEKENIPVVLQTHILEHVALYEHFGFKLIEEAVSDKLKLSCYNMMRYCP